MEKEKGEKGQLKEEFNTKCFGDYNTMNMEKNKMIITFQLHFFSHVHSVLFQNAYQQPIFQ